MDVKFFTAEMTRTGAVLNKQCTQTMLETYWEEFKDWPDEKFAGAIRRCRKQLDFFPTIKQIRERVVVSNSYVPPLRITEVKPTGSLEQNATDLTIDELETLLSNTDYEEKAKQVIRQRFRKDATQPFIRNLIRDLLSPNWNEHNERTFACLLCKDQGVVEVYQSGTCKRAVKGNLDPIDCRTWVVACNCKEGEKHRTPAEYFESGKCKPLPEYQDWMVIVTQVDIDSQINEIVSHYCSKGDLIHGS